MAERGQLVEKLRQPSLPAAVKIQTDFVSFDSPAGRFSPCGFDRINSLPLLSFR